MPSEVTAVRRVRQTAARGREVVHLVITGSWLRLRADAVVRHLGAPFAQLSPESNSSSVACRSRLDEVGFIDLKAHHRLSGFARDPRGSSATYATKYELPRSLLAMGADYMRLMRELLSAVDDLLKAKKDRADAIADNAWDVV